MHTKSCTYCERRADDILVQPSSCSLLITTTPFPGVTIILTPNIVACFAWFGTLYK